MGQERPAALALLWALVLGGCGVTLHERDFLFPAPGTDRLPSDSIARRNVEIAAGDGIALRGWLLERPESRATLVYFYGNAQSVAGTAGELFALADALEVDVLCVDYRGYGYSDGEPSFVSLRDDGLRVFDYARARAGGRPVWVLGYSLGTGVAVHVAANRDVGRLVLAAPLASPRAMVRHIESRLPWYARLFFSLKMGPGFRRVKPAPDEEMSRVTEPLLVLHGTADQVVPIRQGRRMFQLAGSREKRFCEVAGSGHAMSFRRTPIFAACLRSFLGPS